MATAEQQSGSAPVAVIASSAREFTGVLRHVQSQRQLDWPVEFACEAQVEGQPWLLVADGPGPRLAAHATEQVFAHARPKAVVSTGYCGALNPGLQVADIFVASEVRAPESSRVFPALDAPAGGTAAPRGPLLSYDRVASTVEEKADLHARGADAVEMEAAAVAEWAQRYQTDFYCIRVVSDTAFDALPLDFNQFRDGNGRFHQSRIVLRALVRPSLMSALMKLNRNCQRASTVLGEFLVRCRF